MLGIKMQSNYDKNMLEWLVFKEMVSRFEKDVTFEDDSEVFVRYAAYLCGYSSRTLHIYLLNLVDTSNATQVLNEYGIVHFLKESPEFNDWMEEIYLKYRS